MKKGQGAWAKGGNGEGARGGGGAGLGLGWGTLMLTRGILQSVLQQAQLWQSVLQECRRPGLDFRCS